MVERIRSLVRETAPRIPARALMGNHLRILVIRNPADLPPFMRRLLTGYRKRGIPLAEIARRVGIGTTGLAMAVREMKKRRKTE